MVNQLSKSNIRHSLVPICGLLVACTLMTGCARDRGRVFSSVWDPVENFTQKSASQMAAWRPFAKKDAEGEQSSTAENAAEENDIQTASAEEPSKKQQNQLLSFFQRDNKQEDEIKVDPFLSALQSNEVVSQDIVVKEKTADKKPAAETKTAAKKPATEKTVDKSVASKATEKKDDIQVTSLTTNQKPAANDKKSSDTNSMFVDGFDEELNRLRKEYESQQKPEPAKEETKTVSNEVDQELLESLFEEQDALSKSTQPKSSRQEKQDNQRRVVISEQRSSSPSIRKPLGDVDADLVQQLDERYSPFEEVDSSWSSLEDNSRQPTQRNQAQNSNWQADSEFSNSNGQTQDARRRQPSQYNNGSMIKESREVPSRFSKYPNSTVPFYNSSNGDQNQTRLERQPLLPGNVAPNPPVATSQNAFPENQSPKNRSNVQPVVASGHQQRVSQASGNTNANQSVSANQSISIPEEQQVASLFGHQSAPQPTAKQQPQELADNRETKTTSLFNELVPPTQPNKADVEVTASVPPIFGAPNVPPIEKANAKTNKVNDFMYADPELAAPVEVAAVEKQEEAPAAAPGADAWKNPRIVYLLGIAFSFVFMLNLLRRGGRKPRRRSILKQRQRG